ncbi:gustatory receptor-like Holozoa [Arctopsyche grandis]|uniref:gustatory receptor-like Holozoa n=1 Tax=Arctopsyche grandis TaxID=121162 RepID=UPI00406D7C43
MSYARERSDLEVLERDEDADKKTSQHDLTTRQSSATTTEMNSIDMGEIIEPTDTTLMSTSAVLFYCKSKILYPYLKILAVMGLRPVSLNQIHSSRFIRIISHYHTFQISLLICLGYVLQYMSCFRRDRGYFFHSSSTDTVLKNFSGKYDEVCYSSSTFTFFLPNTLHFIGYIYAIYLFRISDNEQLQNLMERVFLLSSFPPQRTPYTSPRKLLRILWFYIIMSVMWMLISLTIVSLMTSRNSIMFLWVENSSRYFMMAGKFFIVLCTFTHDMAQATIITSYCLQAQLLTAHLYFLRNRLLTRTIAPLDWMREVAEFKKLLTHLNEVLAPGICIFTIVNICWMLSGFFWIFDADRIDSLSNHNIYIHGTNLALWVLAVIVPFVSAARLTTACSTAQSAGHEISVRPFLYQDASQSDLNAVLLYASSLQLSARLFRLPITGRYLCLALTIASVGILTLGMCHYISL